MNTKIDIITYIDNNYHNLYDTFFLSSYNKYLSNDFNLVNIKAKSNNNNETFFESKNWCEIIINRFDILCSYIRNNKNKWAIFSDTDVVFFDNIKSNIDDIINSRNNIPIWYMSENLNNFQSLKAKNKYILSRTRKEINGGFFLFYCCDMVYKWFNYIKTNISSMSKPNDQVFIQDLINKQNSSTITFTYDNNEYKIPFELLDPLIFATNNNNKQVTIRHLKSIKAFHATSALTVIEKLQILSSVYCIKNNIRGINLWL